MHKMSLRYSHLLCHCWLRMSQICQQRLGAGNTTMQLKAATGQLLMGANLEFGQFYRVTNFCRTRQYRPSQHCSLPSDCKAVVNGKLEGAARLLWVGRHTLDNLLNDLLYALRLRWRISITCGQHMA